MNELFTGLGKVRQDLNRETSIYIRNSCRVIRVFLIFCSFLSLAIFFAGCRNPNQEGTKVLVSNQAEKREQLVAGCVVCHGVQEAQRGPILNGMENWYLRDQIEKFRSGVRGAHPPNRSDIDRNCRSGIPMNLSGIWLLVLTRTRSTIRTVREILNW